jgi:NAD(P)-dependent dehydrogenase (short-subunit alcohol dehydrogenase family)
MSEFADLVAIVTGGASGLGAATAALLLERGASVAVLDRTVDGLPDGLFGVVCDITDREQVAAAVGAVGERFGGIDILVNNAGIGAGGDIAANDDDEWHRVLDVNVVGLARVTRATLPWLRKSAHAAIVNTSSIVALVGFPNRALYSASKGAVASVTLAMAADFVHEGIRVNAVVPGTADTPWVGRLLDEAGDRDAAAKALRARQPMGRLVTAPEVANAIVYLASPLSSSTTGVLLPVDAGVAGVRVPERSA